MTRHGLLPPSSPGTANASWRLASILACCGALGLSVGCTTTRPTHVVSSPPPRAPSSSTTTTTTTSTPVGVATNPAGTQMVSSTVVVQAPPAMRDEVTMPRPSPRHVWLAGYWSWRNDRYEWVTGHWELPPKPNARWVPPRWENRGSDYLFHEGYWE